VALLDRYRLLRHVAQGGSSDVFEAEHIHSGKRVALKVLRGELAREPRSVERLRREARSTSSIGHRNIVQVEDFGITPEGAVYLAMEWLDGETLADRIDRGPVAPAAARDLVIQIAAGLGAAHAAGVIHRDLKPANVFLVPQPGSSPLVKLLDFGIAKLLQSDTRLTRTGTFIGTPDYVAPEQALGDEVDARADLYSLGVVLYQLVTGTVPFAGEGFMAVLQRHTTEPPEPPSSRAPHRRIPRALEAVVMRCLEKRPDRRFASADELLRALHASDPAMTPGSAPRIPPQPRVPASAPRPSVSLRLPRRSRAAVLLPFLAVAGVAGIFLYRPGDDAGAPTAVTTSAAGPVASDPAPRAAEVWKFPGKADGFDYTVWVSPRAIRPGESFTIDVEILPGAALARAWRPGAVRARLTFVHDRARRIELRGEFPVGDGDRLSAALTLPRSGLHHVELALNGAGELRRARFDLCVGADPSGPRRALERVCPRMERTALDPPRR
jgi:eukaryotic-like serine/threonine-protein kinase